MGFASRRYLQGWLAICLLLAIMLYVSHSVFPSTVGDSINQKGLPLQGKWREGFKGERSTLTPDTHSQCTEVTHLVYIKVPKTGSGTMTSILNYFGFVRNLTFALSTYGTHFKSDPILKQDILPIADGKHYDLLVNHATYNRDTIWKVFPKDTKVFATIREPFSNFISSFYYSLNSPHSTNITRDIEGIINERYQNILENPEPFPHRRFNRLAVRLGIPNNTIFNVKLVQTYIDSIIDKDFDLVMLQEYFDESLVLLKRYFCWSLNDIIYLSYHVNGKLRTDHVYTEDLLQKYRKIAATEFLIYDHFYKKFLQVMWKEGPTFLDEVRVFKGILNRVQSFCMRKPPDNELLLLPSSVWNSPFAITGNRCKWLRKDIVDFADFQKLKQQKEILNPDSRITMEA